MVCSKFFLFFVTLFYLSSDVFAQGDSVSFLSFHEFSEMVRIHHPIAKQANLKVDVGAEQVQASKGSFDPKLSNSIGQKYFDGTQYYSLINVGLQIPTWFGIEIYTGYDQNQGAYLNDASTTPTNGLFYAGVSVPLGQDLFIDKRMYALQQAKIYEQSSLAERNLLINDLLFQASQAYWQWFHAYHKTTILFESYNLAVERAGGVKKSALIGDRPAIDTLEAGIQVQNRFYNYNQARLELEKAKANLSIYLWFGGNLPMEITDNVKPLNWELVKHVEFISNQTLQIDSLINHHPAILVYQYKSDLLVREKHYKSEQLKPEVNLKYNAITENTGGSTLGSYSGQNYTWGLEFSSSLFLREERAQLQITKIQQENLNLEMELQKQKLTAEFNYAIADWEIGVQQILLFQNTVKDYESLFRSEEIMFMLGESSLFLVNSRENDFINAEIRLLELIVKNQLSQIRTRYSLGILS